MSRNTTSQSSSQEVMDSDVAMISSEAILEPDNGTTEMDVVEPTPSVDIRSVCIKRTGEEVPFDSSKILFAVRKAINEVVKSHRSQTPAKSPKRVKVADESDAEKVTDVVVSHLEEDIWSQGLKASVEGIQDYVEASLSELGYFHVAKAYILYRNEHTKKRLAAAAMIGGRVDGLKLTMNAVRLLEQRYLLRDENGIIKESPKEMFLRVAKYIASAEESWKTESANITLLTAENSHSTPPSDKPQEEKTHRWQKAFEELLLTRAFLPASPVLMNAGTDRQLFPAFVFPLHDSIEDIYDTLAVAIRTQKRGGGTGFDFSEIRPKNDSIQGSLFHACGPMTYLQVFSQALKTVKQSGRREGACMGVLRVDHPDILSFVNYKLTGARTGGGSFVNNFNLSVGITDAFMKAVEEDGDYETINPRTKEKQELLSARIVFDSILTSAWQCGDPGLLFLDRINRDNPVPHKGAIACTSACGEQPMIPYESAPEGSINLIECLQSPSKSSATHVPATPDKSIHRTPTKTKSGERTTEAAVTPTKGDNFVYRTPTKAKPSSESFLTPTRGSREGTPKKGVSDCNHDESEADDAWEVEIPTFDWEKLRKVTRIAVRFLEDCHVPKFQNEIDSVSRGGTRRIGLGVMGWADLLYALMIPYNSEDALTLAKEISSTIKEEARLASEELAEERGPFGYWEGSTPQLKGMKPRRNASLLNISPTGSISMIAGVSGGIEPNFALSYSRTVVGDTSGSFHVANTFFNCALARFNVPKNVQDIAIKRGFITADDEIPDEIKKVFITAPQISPEWHVRMQSAWQSQVDAAISKTINLPKSASVKDVEVAILNSFRAGCKGITVYRDGSLDNQIINVGNS